MNERYLKIFHMADFHLDSPFAGLDLKASDERRASLRMAFSSALSRAVSDGCNLVLIAGDLFDCGYVTAETVEKTFKAIGKCPLPVVISPGNHDPFVSGGVYSKKDLPENLYVFSSEKLERIDLDTIGVSVHGYAFTGDRLDESPVSKENISLHPKNVNLLLAHADLYAPFSKYAPLSPRTLESSGFVYAALGHVHKRTPPESFGRCLAAYSGFPEGRGFDELGYGGALEVTVDRETLTADTERVILSLRRYEWEKLDCSGMTNPSDAEAAIRKLIRDKGFGVGLALRVTLFGAVSPEFTPPTSLSGELLGLELFELINETSPVFDAAYLENDVSLRGALYRELLPALRSDDPEKRRVAAKALHIGLAALDGRPFM